MTKRGTRDQISNGARAGSVSTRIWPLYYPHDYEKARASWTSFEMAGRQYDEYLDQLGEDIGADVEKYGSVLIAPMYVEEVTEWAMRTGLEANSAAARRKYLRTYPPGGMYAVEDVSGVFILLRADSMRVLRSTTISSSTGTADMEGFRAALEASEAAATKAYEDLSGALGSRVEGLIGVSYEAHGLLNGNKVPLEGGLALQVEKGFLAVESAAHEDLLRALIRLGTVSEARLVVRAKGENGAEMVWGWVISPEGVTEVMVDDPGSQDSAEKETTARINERALNTPIAKILEAEGTATVSLDGDTAGDHKY